MYQEIIKIENSLLAIFDKFPCTIAHGLRPDFRATLKIHKKLKFNRNQLKISTQHDNMYIYQKKYKNGEFSHSHF